MQCLRGFNSARKLLELKFHHYYMNIYRLPPVIYLFINGFTIIVHSNYILFPIMLESVICTIIIQDKQSDHYTSWESVNMLNRGVIGVQVSTELAVYLELWKTLIEGVSIVKTWFINILLAYLEHYNIIDIISILYCIMCYIKYNLFDIYITYLAIDLQ